MSDAGDDGDTQLARRSLLGALVGGGLVGSGWAAFAGATGTASAATPSGTIGTSNKPLQTVFADQLGTSSTPINTVEATTVNSGTVDTTDVIANSVGASTNRVPDMYADASDVTNATLGTATIDTLDRQNMGAVGYLSTNQAISDNTWTKIGFDSEVYDDRAEFDTASGTFTAAKDGRYDTEATVHFPAVPDQSQVSARIVHNGTDVISRFDSTVRGTGTLTTNTKYSISVGVNEPLVSADTLEFEVKQVSGGSVDISGGRALTNFEITRN